MYKEKTDTQKSVRKGKKSSTHTTHTRHHHQQNATKIPNGLTVLADSISISFIITASSFQFNSIEFPFPLDDGVLVPLALVEIDYLIWITLCCCSLLLLLFRIVAWIFRRNSRWACRSRTRWQWETSLRKPRNVLSSSSYASLDSPISCPVSFSFSFSLLFDFNWECLCDLFRLCCLFSFNSFFFVFGGNHVLSIFLKKHHHSYYCIASRAKRMVGSNFEVIWHWASIAFLIGKTSLAIAMLLKLRHRIVFSVSYEKGWHCLDWF